MKFPGSVSTSIELACCLIKATGADFLIPGRSTLYHNVMAEEESQPSAGTAVDGRGRPNEMLKRFSLYEKKPSRTTTLLVQPSRL